MAEDFKKQVLNSIFDAISIIAEKKVKSYQSDKTIEAKIIDTSLSSNGLYQVETTGSLFPAYGNANEYYNGDIVYVTIPLGDYTKQKFIVCRKVDPEGLPSTTFNFKMPFDDFIPLRNLTGEVPVSWNGSAARFTANKSGRYVTLADWNEIKNKTVHIDSVMGLLTNTDNDGNVLSLYDDNGHTYTLNQVHYIAGDGEDVNADQNTVNHFKATQEKLSGLLSVYAAKIEVLTKNYEELLRLVEDVNYQFEVDDNGNYVYDENNHPVRSVHKYITNGAALGDNDYKITWNGRKMTYLEAIINLITANFSVSLSNMQWVTSDLPPGSLFSRIANEILLPYMKKFINNQYNKQKAAIDNNENLDALTKRKQISELVKLPSNASYKDILPYFAWDSTDFAAINDAIKARYETIYKLLEDEFYTGTWITGGQTFTPSYSDTTYISMYGSQVEGYSLAQKAYSDSLDELNKDNRNLLWTWKGTKEKNILIETKLGISVDVMTLLGDWLPTQGQYGLRFVLTGLPKTLTVVGQSNSGSGNPVTETIIFTNNDMYGNTYGYYNPYTQLKIYDISDLLTLDRIDCYFWQDFDFYDQYSNYIPATYTTVNELGVNVERYIDPNIILLNLRILVGLTVDEMTKDRAILYTYDEPAFGLSQSQQAEMTTKQLELWEKGIEVRDEIPKSNDTKKTLLIAWVHIDEKDGPVLINHELMRHAADKLSLQYWGAKLFWYKFNWNYTPNEGNEADRLGGAYWEPLQRIKDTKLNLDNRIKHSGKNVSDNAIVENWYAAHKNWDYNYSSENENLSIDVRCDLGYLEQQFRAAVVINSKPCLSDTLTCTNRDGTALSLDAIKLRSVILRFMRGKTTADGTNFVIDEDPGGGNFFVYDENNNVLADESGVSYSDIPYYVLIWTLNKNNNTYQPASDNFNFGVSGINWRSFGMNSMIDNFIEPTTEEIADSVLTPITGDMTDDQIAWIKQITRKFYIKSRWDLAYTDNTIKVNMLYQGEPFTCEVDCLFGQMGTMGSEYTIVISLTQPSNSPMIRGQYFEVVARLYKRGIEVPDSKYYINWEILSPTLVKPAQLANSTPPALESLPPLFDSGNTDTLSNIGDWWNRTPSYGDVGGYTNNVLKGFIANDMPLIVRVSFDHAAAYTISATRAFNLVNDANFHKNLSVLCPNRVEYKADGSAPLVDMAAFIVNKNYQETDTLNNDVLFVPSDKKTVYYRNAAGLLLGKLSDGSYRVVTDEKLAETLHDPILDDAIHPVWKLYAYSWDNDEWVTTESAGTDDTGKEIFRTTSIIPHGGSNPKEDGTPGLMAGLSLVLIVSGSEEEYKEDIHGEKIPLTVADNDINAGSFALPKKLDKRIITSDGKEYLTDRYIDYKFSPTTNLNSMGAEGLNFEYPQYFTNTGQVYKGPASWHWDPAYANKYYMFLTWKQRVYSPGSWNPRTKTFTHYHDYWFRQAIALTQNVYSSSLLNSWDGSLLIDDVNNAILAQMIAAGTKDSRNTFTGVIMGDWAKKADSSLDVPGLYGFKTGEQVFGLKVNGTGYIGRSGKGRIEFDGNHGVIKNSDGTCYINLDPIIVRYNENDLGERVNTGSLVFDNYQGFSQFFLYAEVNATTDTAGTEAGNFAWAELIMRYSLGIETKTTKTILGDFVERSSPKDIFVVDPSNGVLTTGGVYARYGRIGKYLLLNDAGISYMEGDTIDNKYFTTTYNLTNSENNNIIYIGQERRRDGSLIKDETNAEGEVIPASREYDSNYWSYLSYNKAYLEAHDPAYGHEQNDVIALGSEKGRYIIWIGNIRPDTNTTLGVYPKFGVEHDGTVHMTEAYVQGEIHANNLVIGDEDSDEYDRNRGQKNFYSKVRKDHPEDILWQNPALLKKPLAGSNLYGVNSNGITGGTCRKHYGDWLRPGDTWYISSEAIPVVSLFLGRGANANAANPSYDNPYDLADTVVAITKYSITFNDNSGFLLQKIDKRDSEGNVIKEWVNKLDDDGHVMYDTNGNPIRVLQNVKIKQIVYTGDGDGIPYTKYTVETRKAYLKQGKYFRETAQTVDSINVNELEDTLQANAQDVATKTEAVKTAETAYNNDKTADNLKAWNDAQDALLEKLCIYKTNQSKYDAIYSRLETWSKNINSTTDTALDKASYSASALIIEQLDNQQVSEESTDYPVPNPDSLGSADDAITSEGLSLQMSFTQLIWEGVQDEDDNHDWWGTWTSSNAGPSTRVGSRILDSLLKVSDNDYNDGNDVAGLVHPKVLTKEIPSSNGTTSEPIVAKRYSAPPGWRVVGDVNNDSIWDALRHASLTFNRTLHSTTKLLTTNLRQSIADMMDKNGKSQKEALEELLRLRKELTNMLVHLQSDIMDTVYTATADIRGGMDPITFFDDGNCYVFVTKYPIDSNVSGIGTVPAGITIAQLATQSTDNVASTFYLNSKRMGFYRTYEEELGDSKINITVPLLSYYNGTMALAGSLFFGMDYNSYIRGEGLKNSLIDTDGNIKDSTLHPEDFSYTNGTITIYKNYLDGPNSRIVLGNGAIILDGEDNGKDVDGVKNNWFAGVLKSDGSLKKGQQEGGRPYVYIGYGGVNIDENGNMLPATDKYSLGVIRIGKKDSSNSLITIADYEFKTKTNETAQISLPTIAQSSLEPTAEMDYDDLVITVESDQLTTLFPDWNNIPEIYAATISEQGVLLKYKTSTSALTNFELPDITNNYTLKKVYAKEGSIEGKTFLYFTRTNNAAAGEEPSYTYTNPVKYLKTSSTTANLTYEILISAISATISGTSGTYSTTIGGYHVTYSLTVYISTKIFGSPESVSGDTLRILLSTNANSKTGVALLASDEEEGIKDGYIFFSPFNNKKGQFNAGFDDSTSNKYHWLAGWNFKGFNVLANDLHIKNTIYIDTTNIYVYKKIKLDDDTQDYRYVKLADQQWVFDAIKKLMNDPLDKIFTSINEAIRKANQAIATANKALGEAIISVNHSMIGSDGLATLTFRYRKLNGSSIEVSTFKVANHTHSHTSTVTIDKGSISVENGYVTGPASTSEATIYGGTKTTIKCGDTGTGTGTITIAGKEGTIEVDVSAPMEKAFKNGWNAAIAAIKVSATPTNLTADGSRTWTVSATGGDGKDSFSKKLTITLDIQNPTMSPKDGTKKYDYGDGGYKGTLYSLNSDGVSYTSQGNHTWRYGLESGTYYTGATSNAQVSFTISGTE